jgi:hypothetical protein
VMKTDLSGLIPQSVRGARMGGNVFYLGTVRPPESLIYDCCANGYAELSDDQIDKQDFYHKAGFWTGRKGRGFVNISDWKASQGLSGIGLSKLPFHLAQPNQSCADAATYITPDLACTIVKKCEHGKCGNGPDGDGDGGGNGGGYPWGWLCPDRSKPIDGGYESDPRFAGNEEYSPPQKPYVDQDKPSGGLQEMQDWYLKHPDYPFGGEPYPGLEVFWEMPPGEPLSLAEFYLKLLSLFIPTDWEGLLLFLTSFIPGVGPTSKFLIRSMTPLPHAAREFFQTNCIEDD